MRKTKVLIIDDSRVFREIISRGIRMDTSIEVVATAVDPFDARDKILKFRPDVLTCDIEMPKMDGIEFVRRLIPQYPLPVIVISSISHKVLDAMQAGAVEFITKPDSESPISVQDFIRLLIKKIKGVTHAKVAKTQKRVDVRSHKEQKQIEKHKVIAIGASTGGTEAIYNLLKQLPKEIPGIIIVQHIPPVFSRMFAERLNQQTHFNVKEAENGDVVHKGCVYLAPGDKHMQITYLDGLLSLKVYEDDKVNGHCPSVDVLFFSAAQYLGAKAMGIILTGMGYDGARGIAMMKRRGAITLGQDEASSVVYGMPRAAYELKGITQQSSLHLMGYYIMKYLE